MIKSIFKQEADIEVIVKNQRPSKNCISNGYRPNFRIKEDYLTSGELKFKNILNLEFNKEAIAEVRFITPELYPHCLTEGQVIPLQEGAIVHGYAKIIKIYNKTLKS